MRKPQLEALLCEVARVAGERQLVVVGSQCVHAATDHAPAEVLMSLECDVLVEEADPAAALLDRELGPGSAYHDAHEVYVDTVPAGLPFLPAGWEARLQAFEVPGRVRCLELHDMAVAKLAAGRLKDYELVAALVTVRMLQVPVLEERILATEEARMRAVLLARLRIVLESLGR